MTKKEVQKVAMASESIENDNLSKLRSVFPQFVKDGEVDFDTLQAFLKAEGSLSGEEKYGLSWSGKSNAFRALRTPATGTLTPQPKESKDWDKTENIFIEGDNLEVLKLLQKHYRGLIKMIYIDPPYNTGKDFIYKDNFTQNVSDYYEQTGQTKDGIRMTANTEKNGRYHSDWLTMMYPRLFLARNLLKDDGVIFVSIDDNEVANLRLIMDEIFGEENFVAEIAWQNLDTIKNDAQYFSDNHEYILCYSKNKELLKILGIKKTEKQRNYYKNFDEDGRGDYLLTPLHAKSGTDSGIYEYKFKNGRTWRPPQGTYPRFSKETLTNLEKDNRIYFSPDGGVPQRKTFWDEVSDRMKLVTFWDYDFGGSTRRSNRELSFLLGKGMFDNPKPTSLIKILLEAFSSDEDFVLDFFAGSGTTAHAVMELNAEDEGNRKWLCVQLPETTDDDSEAFKAGYKTIADIARERIHRAGEVVKHKANKKIDKVGPSTNKNTKSVLPLNEKIKNLDIGFKAYQLSSSNYRQWNALTAEDDEETLKKQTKLFVEKPLVDGYDEKSVVFEIMVKEGFGLNSEVEQVVSEGLKLWKITDSDKRLFVTFAKKIEQGQVTALGLADQDTFVCLDSSLDDTTKVNLVRNFKVKVI